MIALYLASVYAGHQICLVETVHVVLELIWVLHLKIEIFVFHLRLQTMHP